MAQHVAPLLKLAVTDSTGYAAFETTQYVTAVLRIRNVNPATSKELLLELLSHAGNVNTFCLGRAGASAVVWARYADAGSALGAFLLLYHCLVLDGRALLVDFEREGADVFADSTGDESVTVPDQYIAPVLVRVPPIGEAAADLQKEVIVRARTCSHPAVQELVAKFNKRANTNVPKGFQGLRKRFLVPVSPPFARLSFGLSLQLTTDLALHRRAQAAVAEGAIGLPPDDPGLRLHPCLQGLVVPRALEEGAGGSAAVTAEPDAAAPAPAVPLHKAQEPALDVEALSAVLAAVAAPQREGAVARSEPRVPLAAAAAPPTTREASVPLATARPQHAAAAPPRSPVREGAAKRARVEGLYSTSATEHEPRAATTAAAAKSEEELYAELYSDPVATAAPAHGQAWPQGQAISPDQAAHASLYSPHGAPVNAASRQLLYAPGGAHVESLYAVPEQSAGAQAQRTFAEQVAQAPAGGQAAQGAGAAGHAHAALYADASHGHAGAPYPPQAPAHMYAHTSGELQHSWGSHGAAAYGSYGQPSNAATVQQHPAYAPQQHTVTYTHPDQQVHQHAGYATQDTMGRASASAYAEPAAQAWQQAQPAQHSLAAAQTHPQPSWQGQAALQTQQPAGYGHSAPQHSPTTASAQPAEYQPPLPAEAPPG